MKFFIKQFQKLKVLSQMHEKILQKKQDKRLVEKNQKKDGTFRRKLQKNLQDVADGKAQLQDEFPELQDNQRSTIAAILTNPAVIIGPHFEHMWFVNNQIVLYQGHVLSVKCSKGSNMPKVTATYWKHV